MVEEVKLAIFQTCALIFCIFAMAFQIFTIQMLSLKLHERHKNDDLVCSFESRVNTTIYVWCTREIKNEL